MPEPASDLYRSDWPPFPPEPSRRQRITHRVLMVLIPVAIAAVAFVLLLALNHIGQVVQHNLHVAFDHLMHRLADTYCGPPADR